MSVQKIAITYDNGQVFQHFGHTETFKLYEVEDGKLLSSRLLASNGSGHGALAGLLAEQGVNVLICGGIGGGAQTALEEQGITLCAGASGNADEAVAAYLRGELVNTGANCDHHHEEGHSCHDHEEGHSCHDHKEGHECGAHEEGGCGGHTEGGCGSCGGCHGKPKLEGKNVGKTVRTHYRGTFNDGKQFDSSYDRGEPLEFVCGAGMMIPGYDAAVADMEIGQTVQVHLMPGEAYGEADPEAIFTIPLAEIPGAENVSVGERVYLQGPDGQAFPVRVTAKDETSITFDANHEMAGKELNFTIELMEVLD